MSTLNAARALLGKRIVTYILGTGAFVTPFLLAHFYLDHYHWAPLRQECEESVSKYRAKEAAYREECRLEKQAHIDEIGQLAKKRAYLLQEIENTTSSIEATKKLRNGGKNGN